MAKDIITLDRNGVQVEFSKTELVSLTQLWRMAGSPQSQTPNKWKILPEAKRLVKQISKEDKGFKSSFMESKRGKGGFPSPCGVNIVAKPRLQNAIHYAVFKVQFL